MDETKCARCGRDLKDANSIARGFGPVCWGRVQAELEREDAETDTGEEKEKPLWRAPKAAK